MKYTRITILLGALLAACTVNAQVSLTPGMIVTESFNAIDATNYWTDNTTLPGWYAAVTNAGSGEVTTPSSYYNTAGGGSGSTKLFTINSSGSSERALGGLPSLGAGRLLLGWRMVNSGTEALTNLVLSYDGEQWRRDTSADTHIYVSYQIFNGGEGSLTKPDGWIAAPDSLTFNPTVTGAAAAINGNLPENRATGLSGSITGITLQPGQEIWFSWYLVKLGGGNIFVGVDNAKVMVPFGAAPVIGAIPDMTAYATLGSITNTFTLDDADEGASSPALETLYAQSSNEAVVPSANVYLGGTGTNRTVSVVAGATPGAVDITVTAYDSYANTAQRTFSVIVLPLVSTPATTNTLVDAPVSVPFIVYKPGASSSLTVTGAVASYSSAILTNVQVTAAADGTNFTATVTPVNGATGVGVVTLSVGDGSFVNTASYTVTVLPDATTVLYDHFDYPPNTSIINSSPGFWLRRGSVQSVNFRTHATEAQAWIRPKSGADDIAAPLVGRPYTRGSGAVIYTSFKAQWNLLEDTVPVVGDSGAFFLLAGDPTTSGAQLLQLATRTNGVPDGSFRLQVSNGTDTYTEHPANLSTNITYAIMTRYDVDTATSTLWIDAASEAATGVTATDPRAPASVSYITLRQEPNSGHIYLDDLKAVVLLTPEVVSIKPPVAGEVEIIFNAGVDDSATAFEVHRAGTVNGLFSVVPATITALGNGQFKAVVQSTASEGYYRLVRKPLAF